MDTEIKLDDQQKSALLKKINDYRTKWESYAHEQFKKVLDVKKYIYDTKKEKEDISTKGSIQNTEKITISTLRPASNRAKTDYRDLQPFFVTKPRSMGQPPETKKILSSILDSIVLTPKNNKAIYRGYDSLLDMSVSVMRVNVKAEYDKVSKNISKKIILENVEDILNVYFDCSVLASNIGTDGKCCGYTAVIETENGNTEITDHFEKVMKTTVYGERYVASTDSWVCEEVQPTQIYSFEYPIEEIDYIQHVVVKDGNIELIERWGYERLPYEIGFGVHIDDMSETLSKRLVLVPFLEHCISAQNTLNYAATMQMYNIKMSRTTTKAMYAPEMIEGFEDEWATRNVSEADLRYNILKDDSGAPLPMRPEFVPDVPTSPVVTEILSTYPALINALTGVNLEQDITYNASGEAIRQMQMVRHKNAKLYGDDYLDFLNRIGESLAYYIPMVYDKPQFIVIDNYGTEQIIKINDSKPQQGQNGYQIKELFGKYDVSITTGQTPATQRERTQSELTKLYSLGQGLPIAATNILNTIDIFASSLDTPEAQEIARRVKLGMPPQIIQLENGQVTEKQLIQQAAQAQQQGQQQQNQQAQAQAQAQMMDNQAKIVTAQAKMKEADNKLQIANIESNAEIAKSFSQQGE